MTWPVLDALGNHTALDMKDDAQVAEVYRKMRLTLRYMLGNLAGFEAGKAVPYAELPRIDRYILGRFASLLDESKTAYDSFSFYRIYQVKSEHDIACVS